MRVLVTATSKHGATAEIARAVGEALREAHLEADVLAPDEVDGLEGYDAVVLGSAVYMGRWLDPAKRFVDRNRTLLLTRPVWLFSSGPLGDPPKPDQEPVDVGGLREATGARDHRIFPGRLAKRGLGLAEKAIVTAFRAPEGDFRSWDEIRAWATAIAHTLQEEPPETVSSWPTHRIR